jgi:hypothetical protein
VDLSPQTALTRLKRDLVHQAPERTTLRSGLVLVHGEATGTMTAQPTGMEGMIAPIVGMTVIEMSLTTVAGARGTGHLRADGGMTTIGYGMVTRM